jgi:hypothetical protein
VSSRYSVAGLALKAKTFRKMLPELGVNGSVAKDCTDGPARGKVFAKTGTLSLPDFVNRRLIEWSMGFRMKVHSCR